MLEAAHPQDRSLRAIIPLVLILHAAGLLWMTNFSTWKPQPAPPKRLAVNVKLQPKAIPPAVKPPSIAKAAPKIEPAPPPQVVAVAEIQPETPPVKETSIAKLVTAPAPEKPQETPKAEPKKKAAPDKPPAGPPSKAPTQAEKPAPKKTTTSKPSKKKSAKGAAKTPTKAKGKKEGDKTPAKAKGKKEEAKASTPKQNPAPHTQSNASQEALKQKQRTLLSQAKEKIGKIDTSSDKLLAVANSSLIGANTPSRIESLNIDTLSIDSSIPLNTKERAYRDELAQRLKLLLKLPEYGEVKLKLTVERSGEVSMVKILSSQSSANKKYIEKTLPKLKMPPFGDNFGVEGSNTFTITMSNE